MGQFKDINQVWMALDNGLTVCWVSDSYQITIEDSQLDWRKRNGFDIPFSNRDGKCLRVTCMSNWFGSLLLKNEVQNLYIKKEVSIEKI